MHRLSALTLALSAVFVTSSAFAQVNPSSALLAQGSLSGSLSDLSGLTGTLENGVSASLLGGMGSGLAWAGGSTFLALPDRGPNATAWTGGAALDNTASYIARFNTVDLSMAANSGAGLSYNLTPTLTSTTLLWSATPLNYGAATSAYGSGAPAINTADHYYFTGRSDNFAAGLSTNPNNARLDPEAIRMSNDGKSVYISDEYGPYVYQFDRATGQRTNTYTLPSTFAISNLSSTGATEISGNTSGRVANKGMEGLAITPDGKTLVGFEQSPLIQDGGDGGQANRIVTIDVATGTTHQYAYNNLIGSKTYNSSEILAVNDHQFLVLERDGKGLGDGTTAAVKQVYMVDIAGATDVSGLTGQAALLAVAPTKTLFLDVRAALNAAGISDAQIPAKLEGMAWGQDVVVGGVTKHTLYIANDNDFLATAPGGLSNPNKWFVFGVTDAELSAMGASFTQQALAVPEGNALAMALVGLAGLGLARRRRTNA